MAGAQWPADNGSLLESHRVADRGAVADAAESHPAWLAPTCPVLGLARVQEPHMTSNT